MIKCTCPMYPEDQACPYCIEVGPRVGWHPVACAPIARTTEVFTAIEGDVVTGKVRSARARKGGEGEYSGLYYVVDLHDMTQAHCVPSAVSIDRAPAAALAIRQLEDRTTQAHQLISNMLNDVIDLRIRINALRKGV